MKSETIATIRGALEAERESLYPDAVFYDYDEEIARIDAALADLQAEAEAEAGAWMDMPDGPGWWGYTGKQDGVIRLEDFRVEGDHVIMHWWGDVSPMKYTIVWFKHFMGDPKFYRLTMPWEQRTTTPQPAPGVPMPNWNDAPEWAMWWAVDGATGAAFWHERKPEKYKDEGWINGGRSELAYRPGWNWFDTLRQRTTTPQ